MITKINPFAQIYEAFRGFTDPDAFYHLRKQSSDDASENEDTSNSVSGLSLKLKDD